MVKSGIAIRFFNQVCNTPEVSNDEVLQIKNFFGAAPYYWVVESHDLVLSKLLEKNGLTYKSSLPAMVLDLNTLKHVDCKPGITVRRVVNDQDMAAWRSITQEVCNYQEKDLISILEYLTNRASRGAITLYLGYYEEKPVAVSMAIVHKDVVTLHFVCTLPEYRCKGLGYAVSYQPLIDAHSKNYKQALLLSSSAGEKLYQVLGFKVYAMYKMYGNY